MKVRRFEQQLDHAFEHSYWDKHQSPIKQLSGATNIGSGTATPLQTSCHIYHQRLQVFIQQGDALRGWLLMPAGPRLPGWTARRTASVYAITEALSSQSFQFHNFNTRRGRIKFLPSYSDICSHSTCFQRRFAAWSTCIPSNQNRFWSS